jgi:hypothetical protein
MAGRLCDRFDFKRSSCDSSRHATLSVYRRSCLGIGSLGVSTSISIRFQVRLWLASDAKALVLSPSTTLSESEIFAITLTRLSGLTSSSALGCRRSRRMSSLPFAEISRFDMTSKMARAARSNRSGPSRMRRSISRNTVGNGSAEAKIDGSQDTNSAPYAASPRCQPVPG